MENQMLSIEDFGLKPKDLEEPEEPKVTWRNLLKEKMMKCGESFSDIQSNTMSDEEMDKEFDDGFGGQEGCPFTVWTKKRIYFPAIYDGSGWVASVSRNPDNVATKHIGEQIGE